MVVPRPKGRAIAYPVSAPPPSSTAIFGRRALIDPLILPGCIEGREAKGFIERPSGFRRQQDDRVRGCVFKQPCDQIPAYAATLAFRRDDDQPDPRQGIPEGPAETDAKRVFLIRVPHQTPASEPDHQIYVFRTVWP